MTKRTDRARRRSSNTPLPDRPLTAAVPPRSKLSIQADAGSFSNRLARLLDAPDLARIVPRLAPETLHQFIQQCGLDACGDLVASATAPQLAKVFDLDLWRQAQPGRDDRFDANRFGEWLEALVNTSSTVAARTIAAMDPDLVVAGLSRFVRVFDPGTFEPTAQSDDEPMSRPSTPDGGVECEVGGYLVRAANTEAWDAIVALLLALDTDHHECFHAVMCGCRRLSNSAPEVDGLDDLFTVPDQLMHEVALDREDRRSRQGYSTPADARAFLEMARRRRTPPGRELEINPIAGAYLRAAKDAAASADAGAGATHLLPSLESSETFDALSDIVAEVIPAASRPRALLEGSRPEQSRHAHIRTMMDYLGDSGDAAYFTRVSELAFLANTLVAGCPLQSRAFTPQDASDAALGVCNLGVERWVASGAEVDKAFLADHDLVTAFELGWTILHEDVCMFAAERLLAAVADLQCVDADIQQGLHTLEIQLRKEAKAGTPWRARGAVDAIAMLDLPAWTSLLGLIAECPVMPAMLTAVVDGQTGAISATAFEFISTAEHIETVRAFLAGLPDALRR